MCENMKTTYKLNSQLATNVGNTHTFGLRLRLGGEK